MVMDLGTGSNKCPKPLERIHVCWMVGDKPTKSRTLPSQCGVQTPCGLGFLRAAGSPRGRHHDVCWACRLQRDNALCLGFPFQMCSQETGLWQVWAAFQASEWRPGRQKVSNGSMSARDAIRSFWQAVQKGHGEYPTFGEDAHCPGDSAPASPKGLGRRRRLDAP